MVFWDVTPCNLIYRYQPFGGICRLHLHVFILKVRGSTFLLIVRTCVLG
jgi:hypothetical protein